MDEHLHSDSIDLDTGRIEAFSDGVLAIIITIMVLEIRPPKEATLEALRPSIPIMLAYLLSFIFIGIYWNNHHHLLKATDHINGGVMWANLHLLYWLSLIPVGTAWIGAQYKHPWPAVMYGVVCFMAGVAYSILVRKIIAANPGHRVQNALGSDLKGKISLVIYAAGVGLSFISPWLGYIAYASVSAIWFIPDRRIERLTS